MRVRATLACGALTLLSGCAHRGRTPSAAATEPPAYPLPVHPGPAPMPLAAERRPFWRPPSLTPTARLTGQLGVGRHQYYDAGKRRFYYYDPAQRRYFWESGELKR